MPRRRHSSPSPIREHGIRSPSGGRRLCVRRLPLDYSEICEGDLKKMFKNYGVKHVELVKDSITGELRGYAFITFHNHADAALAKRHLNGKQIGGLAVSIDFYYDYDKPWTPNPSSVKKLCVRGLPLESSKICEGDLRTMFKDYGVKHVELVKDSITCELRGYAFVTFHNHADAALAKRHLNGKHIGGLAVSIDFMHDKGPTPEATRKGYALQLRQSLLDRGNREKRASSSSPRCLSYSSSSP